MDISKRKIWRGKWVTEAVYNKRLKQTENGRKRKKLVSDVTKPVTVSVNCTNFPVKGCRIVNLEYIAKLLNCQCCIKPLHLINIENEVKKGLASILQVRCVECLTLNDIPTGMSHVDVKGKRRFDINSKAALGGLHTGLGHSHIEKFLVSVNVPAFTSRTFKSHEREMGKIVEKVAKESCVEAAKLERKLTIEKAKDLAQLM